MNKISFVNSSSLMVISSIKSVSMLQSLRKVFFVSAVAITELFIQCCLVKN
jgi:hypothetical protein